MKEKIKCIGENCNLEDTRFNILFHQLECEQVTVDLKIDIPLYTKLVSFFIGVGKYSKDSELSNLISPPKDVKELKRTLERIGFDQSEQNCLLNEEATKEGIEEFFLKMEKTMLGETEEEKKFNSESMLVFFFSGHGVEDSKNRHQICPHDYSENRGIEMGELIHKLSKINCKHVLIILDCCHSGAILNYSYAKEYRQEFSQYERKGSSSSEFLILENSMQKSIWALTSSDSTEKSLGSKIEENSVSVFTNALLSAFDPKNKHFLFQNSNLSQVTDLFNSVTRSMHFGETQNPHIARLGSLNDSSKMYFYFKSFYYFQLSSLL